MADEYIRREDALEALDNELIKHPHSAISYAFHAIRLMLCELPAADVAPVVRCKDCASWHGNPETRYGVCDIIADRDQEGGASFDAETEFDDYCSHGSRKAQANEQRA